jgi:hypothetical protein
MTTRPEELADAILASVSGEPNQGPSDVFIALVYSTSAVSQLDVALAAIAEAEASKSVDPVILGTGAAGLCGLALHLALAATRRHAKATDDLTVPFTLAELDGLIEATLHVRDSVVHWDDKLGRDPKTFLAFSRVELMVYAPSGKAGPIQIANLSWDTIADAARRCRDWARATVKPPVFD